MLIKRYNKSRKLKLTAEEFSILCLLTPCYLVAQADGHFDKEEQKAFDDFLLGFFEGYIGKRITGAQLLKLKNVYVNELAFIQSDAVWLIHILEHLKSMADKNKKIIDIINASMMEVAVISSNVSKEEKSVMQFVIKNLH